MKREKPINADLPEAPPQAPKEKAQPPEAPKPEPEPASAPPEAVELARDMTEEAQQPSTESPTPSPGPPPPQSSPQPLPEPPRRRQPKPLTPKLLAALALLAIAFIVAAVLGGTGGSSDEPTTTVTPAPDTSAGGEAQSAESLGFPGFATNNTTRLGGSDAASIAAAAALAAFPSTTAAQRPAAVTLVGEEDWAGAVASAVLMAEPVRAPLLISGPSLPDVTAEAFEALGPAGFEGGTQAFQIGALATPGGTKITRVGSRDAATEAAEIAKLRDRLFGSKPRHVVVAPASQPELAVPAAAWAARSGDPVLFAERDDLPAATATALREYAGIPVYVLGPAAAISDKVLAGIRKIAGQAKRVGGDGPVANALALARYDGGGGFGWNVNDPGHGFVLARAESPLAAAAAAALSGSGTWGPLLLSDSATKLPAELRSYFLDVKPGYTNNPTRAFYNHVWVIGDQEAIDVNQQAEVNELAELAKIGGEG